MLRKHDRFPDRGILDSLLAEVFGLSPAAKA
jgi:hypothetical protein